MSPHDDDRDAELTSDWPSSRPGPPPAAPWGPPPAPPQQPWGGPPSPGPGWGPPPPPPPSYPPPVSPAPATSKGPKRALIGVTVVAVIALAAGGLYLYQDGSQGRTDTAATTSAPPTTAAPAPSSPPQSSPTPAAPNSTAESPTTVGAGALSTYLASPEEAGRVADNQQMTPSAISKEPYDNVNVDPFSCTGAVVPGIEAAYAGSDYTGFAAQNLISDDQKFKVIQAVASFATPEDAQAFVDRQVSAWKQCTYTDVTATVVDGAADQLTTGVVGERDDIASLLIFPPGGGAGRNCERAIAPRNNVVVDVRVCADSVGSAGRTLAGDIAEKITGNR